MEAIVERLQTEFEIGLNPTAIVDLLAKLKAEFALSGGSGSSVDGA